MRNEILYMHLQHVIKFDLRSAVQALEVEFLRGQWADFSLMVFVNNFAPMHARAMNLPPLCFSRRDGSKYIRRDLKKSTSNLRSHGKKYLPL